MSEKSDYPPVPLTPVQKAAVEIDDGPQPKPSSAQSGWLSYLKKVREKLGNLSDDELEFLEKCYRDGVSVEDAIAKIKRRRNPPRKVPDSDTDPSP
jgi:hypothetical protein